MNRQLSELGVKVSTKKVLDIACGGVYPYSFLYHCTGVDIIGSDLLKLRNRDIEFKILLNKLRSNNILIELRHIAIDVFIWIIYYRIMSNYVNINKYVSGTKLVTTDANSMGFKSESFDLVVSFASFEHFLDVPKVTAELFRVLKPGGYAYLNIHLWTSLSGGHEKEFWDGGIPKWLKIPWNHLRDRNWNSNIPLNRWREKDYCREFEKSFEIIKRTVESELGRHLITKDVLNTLPEYSTEELAIERVVFILKKPNF